MEGNQSFIGAQLVSSARALRGELQYLESPGLLCYFITFAGAFSGRLAFRKKKGLRSKYSSELD